MSTPKGYPSQQKEDRSKSEFCTVEPIRALQHGLSVLSHEFVRVAATDAVEASSTTKTINATSHMALKGDVIHFTSGALIHQEVKVASVTTNVITLAEELASAPATGVTFEILRHKYPVVDNDGLIGTSAVIAPTPIMFVRDGVDTEVNEDTVTPANNLPLPVKLVGLTGDVSITADNLNVQLSAAGATPDSVRIGDGTDTALVTAAGELNVISTAQPGVDIGDVTINNAAGASAVNVQDGGNSLTVDGTVAATQSGTWNVNNISGTISLPTGASTLTEQQTQTTALQLLDDVVASTGAAIPSKGYAVSGSDGTNARVLKTNSSGELQVDVLSQPALSHSSDSVKIGDGTEFASVTASNQLEVAVTAALPAGTNAIGTVSVATYDVVDFLDTPLLDASSTNIPASASTPLTVIASLASRVRKVQAIDTTGKFVGVYADPAGTPVLQFIIGPGSDSTVEVDIPASTVLGVRNMENATITTGNLVLNLMG